jgi:hypothetical protein
MPNAVIFDDMVLQLSSQFARGEFALKEFPETLRIVLGENAWDVPMWRERINQRTGEIVTFETFEDFVKTPPSRGLGAGIKILKDICRHDPIALDLIDQAVQRPHGGGRSKRLNQPLDNDEGAKQDRSTRHLRPHHSSHL